MRSRNRGCLFPGYRWCGPSCSGPGSPINDVDACCMRHDRCLNHGIHPCICDEHFLRCLRPKMEEQSRKARHASLMYGAIRLKTTFQCQGFRGER